MVCQDLSKTPTYELPADYSFRMYSPGDEQSWLLIQNKADLFQSITYDRFKKSFGNAPEELPTRQFFLLNRCAKVVGTATAWFEENFHGES